MDVFLCFTLITIHNNKRKITYSMYRGFINLTAQLLLTTQPTFSIKRPYPSYLTCLGARTCYAPVQNLDDTPVYICVANQFFFILANSTCILVVCQRVKKKQNINENKLLIKKVFELQFHEVKYG